MTNTIQINKKYDLEARTLRFTKNVKVFCNTLPMTQANKIYINQLLRSSGSIGANYIEANESLGKKDFLMRLRISKKEAKETRYWLNLLDLGADSSQYLNLLNESEELMKIFGAIIEKSK